MAHPTTKHPRERGASLVTIALLLVILAAGGYSAAKIIPFYYYYFELENHMQAAIKVARTYSDRELRQKLLAQIKRTQIPASPEDLVIERSHNEMRIYLPYEEVFYIEFRDKVYDLHVFKFRAEAQGTF